MIDYMRMRKLFPKTQSHYLRAVRQFARCNGGEEKAETYECTNDPHVVRWSLRIRRS
jgi:hypothetical protein